MKLIIMRHGQASWSAKTDKERPLTESGRNEVALTGRQLKPHNIQRIIASPYLRTQQTARIIADILGCTVETVESITPDTSPHKVIGDLPDQGNVLAVSHMPLVSALTGLLCDGVQHKGPAFDTAYAAVLDMEMPGAGMATLTEMITPQ